MEPWTYHKLHLVGTSAHSSHHKACSSFGLELHDIKDLSEAIDEFSDVMGLEPICSRVHTPGKARAD
jgi:hypothetical protein